MNLSVPSLLLVHLRWWHGKTCRCAHSIWCFCVIFEAWKLCSFTWWTEMTSEFYKKTPWKELIRPDKTSTLTSLRTLHEGILECISVQHENFFLLVLLVFCSWFKSFSVKYPSSNRTIVKVCYSRLKVRLLDVNFKDCSRKLSAACLLTY